MASLASSIETSLGLPKKTPTPFAKLTEAVILSRRHRSFAYFVEDQQSDDVDDLNLLLCVQSIMKLVEEFEDTSTHGLCNYRDAAIEVTKMFIVEGSKHYCQKVSTLVKKQLLAKLAQPDAFSRFDVDFFPLQNECVKLLESKYLLDFLDKESINIQSSWKELIKCSSPSTVGKEFMEILEQTLPNFSIQTGNTKDYHEVDEECGHYVTERKADEGETQSSKPGLSSAKKISGISLHRDNRLSFVRKAPKKKKSKKRKYEYNFSWSAISGNKESISQIHTRLGREYVMGIAKSVEDLSAEGFTVDVLHSFGSVALDQIIDTSYKAYNAFVESFLTVLHNNLYNNHSWSIATKESWKAFFHIKYYLYLFSNSASTGNDQQVDGPESSIDDQKVSELNYYDEIFRRSAMRVATSPNRPATVVNNKQKDCLTGKTLVEHLIMHPEDWFWNLMVIEFNAWNSRGEPVPTHWEAALFAQELLDRGYLINLTNKKEVHFFDSSKVMYRFTLVPSALCFVPCFTSSGRNEYLIAIVRIPRSLWSFRHFSKIPSNIILVCTPSVKQCKNNTT